MTAAARARALGGALLGAALLAAAPAPAAGVDPHAGHAPAAAPSASAFALRVTDAALVTQDGRAVRFRTEVLADKIVVMDFVYTTCTTVCPVLSALLAQVQGRLGERVGREVRLVSVTVDPVRDTPARLKAYAARYRAGPGWTWLTGPTTTVNGLLKELGAWAPDFTQHPPTVLVGDALSGDWVRYYGFPNPQDIVARVGALEQARAAGGGPVAKDEPHRHAH